MKKYFFFAACASVAFASCVNDVPDAPVNDEQHAITFDVPVVQPNSRTQTEVGTDYTNGGDFKVSAWYFKDGTYVSGADNGQLFMENIQVTKDGGIYKQKDKTYYYPKNGSLTFIAYSPANLSDYTDGGVTVNKANGITITGYTANGITNGNEQDDILFSERRYNQNEGTVSILFNHALSSIRFAASTDQDYSSSATITIRNIELVDVFSKGTFTQNLDDENGKYTKTPVRVAKYDNAQGLDETQKIMVNNMSQDEAAWSASAKINYSISTIPTEGKPLGTSAYTPTTGDRKTDLLLIPQEFADQTLVVTYDVDVTATPGDDFPNQKYMIKFKDLHSTIDKEWMMGYRYTYDIIISLNEITFKPTVEAFLNASQSLDLDE